MALVAALVLAACAGTGVRPEDEWLAWQEDPLSLPAYPDPATLVAVNIGRPGDPYRYFIDPASLHVGRDDVFRYTVVMQSAEGATNVLYEGIRCGRGTGRAFAYGTGEHAFRVLPGAEWEPLSGDGPRAYRFVLGRGYLCTAMALPFDEKTALGRLRSLRPLGIEEQGLGLYR